MAERSEFRILQIGAGGIGCELLKLLVMSGFRSITLIDLDNIDVSNLNRQFLFRRCHVGQPKAKVAAEVVSTYRPGVVVTPIQAPVQSFGSEFFQDFSFVFNALDNDEARRHVNRICAYLKKPLIEAGTQGFLGQVNVHFPPETSCFECEPRAAQKTYAVCTIRSTPDKPVHCIVWAKYLYEVLFGQKEDSNMLSDIVLESEEQLVTKLFRTDIEESKANVNKRALDISEVQEQHTVLMETMRVCTNRPRMQFDKDDDPAMRFVWSASSLRAYNFHIPLISLFDCKEIAGNIIPAVASTNGIAAGIQIAEAIKLIQKHELSYRSVWINEFKSGSGKLILAGKMPKPKTECVICNQSVMKLELKLDIQTFTLGQLVAKVLKAELAMHSPTVFFGETMLYESGADLDEDSQQLYEGLSHKPLQEFSIATDSIVSCDDFSQHYKVELWVKHDPAVDELQHPTKFVLSGSRQVEKAAESVPTSTQQDDSDFEVLGPTKRQRTEDAEEVEGSKRGKWEDSEDVVLVE